MEFLVELEKAVEIVCQKIDADLANRNAEEWAFNHPLNKLKAATKDKDLGEIKVLAQDVIQSYFRRGERITGYIQAGVVTSQEATDLEDAIMKVCLNDKE